MAGLTPNSKILFIEDDINSDGTVDAKDKKGCRVSDLASVLQPLIDTNNTITLNSAGTGFIVQSPTDNSTVNIPFPTPTPAETDGKVLDGNSPPVLNLNARTITFPTVNDLSQTSSSPVVLDISSLITMLTSTPHPELTAGNNVTVTGNSEDGYTISVEDDEDVICTFNTLENGQIQKLAQTYINGQPSGPPVSTIVGVRELHTLIETTPGDFLTTDYTFTLVNAGGVQIGPQTVITTPNNPITNIGIVDGALQTLRSDSTVRNFYSQDQFIRGTLEVETFGPLDENTPLGPIPDSDFYISFDYGSNPIQVITELATSYLSQGAHEGSFITLVPQVTYDGGATWQDMGTGGVDNVYGTKVEAEFIDKSKSGWKAISGVTDIGFRTVVTDNQLSPNDVIIQLHQSGYAMFSLMTSN